jgi:hypothetical protein
LTESTDEELTVIDFFALAESDVSDVAGCESTTQRAAAKPTASRRRDDSHHDDSHRDDHDYWTARYNEVFAHAVEFGGPHGFPRTADGRGQQRWVRAQRLAYAHNRLERGRIDLCIAIPGWDWALGQTPRWDAGYRELALYLAATGTLPHCDEQADSGFPVGAWVIRQRTAHRHGELPTAHVEALEALPAWSWDVRSDNWLRGYEALLDHVIETGTALVPTTYRRPDGLNLPVWIRTQRKAHASGRLLPERVNKLAHLPGWSWHDNAQDTRWVRMFSTCDSLGLAAAKIDPDIRKWLDNQRHRHRIGALPEWRRVMLESLDGWSWNASQPLARPYSAESNHQPTR